MTTIHPDFTDQHLLVDDQKRLDTVAHVLVLADRDDRALGAEELTAVLTALEYVALHLAVLAGLLDETEAA